MHTYKQASTHAYLHACHKQHVHAYTYMRTYKPFMDCFRAPGFLHTRLFDLESLEKIFAIFARKYPACRLQTHAQVNKIQ